MKNPLTISTGIALILFLISSLIESIKSTTRTLSRLTPDDIRVNSAVETSTGTSSDGLSAISPLTEQQAKASVFSLPLEHWRRKADDEIFIHDAPLLRVYVYDSIPREFSDDIVSCMKDLAKVDDLNSFSALTTKMADVAFLQLFDTYPGRTNNPDEADIFFVPYPHAAHCYCAEGWQIGCGHVSDTEIDRVFDSLHFYNATTAARHLFVLSGHQFFTHPRLLSQPLKLLGGNLNEEELDRKERGTIVIPYLNDKMLFQEVFHRPDDWWIRPRQHAFSFVFGDSNSRNTGNDPRRVRVIFRDNWIRRNRTELGGLPVHVLSFNTTAIPKDALWTGLTKYHESIFCPVLAGDSAQQARFFDAMMAGCIPVVLEFSKTVMTKKHPNSWAVSLPSWYRKKGEVTGAVYPFHDSLVDFGIDYNLCVLTVSARGNDDVMKLPGIMDRMILNEMDRIRTIQQNLKHCARRTAFAMGSNAHKYEDAFALVVRMLSHHLNGLHVR